MKKYLGILAVVLFVAVGCGNSKYEDTFKEYATKHYNDHQKGSLNITEPVVTIADLKNAVEVGVQSFDMSKLEGCTDASYVKLTIDESREITDYEFHLECE